MRGSRKERCPQDGSCERLFTGLLEEEEFRTNISWGGHCVRYQFDTCDKQKQKRGMGLV